MQSFYQNIIFETPTLRVEYFGAQRHGGEVAFCFSSFDNKDLEGYGFGGKFFLSRGVDVIAVKNIGCDWYQNLTEDFFQKINHLCEEKNTNIELVMVPLWAGLLRLFLPID